MASAMDSRPIAVRDTNFSQHCHTLEGTATWTCIAGGVATPQSGGALEGTGTVSVAREASRG